MGLRKFTGTIGKKWASGTATLSSDTTNFKSGDGSTVITGLRSITVSGLSFTPSIIILFKNENSVVSSSIYGNFSIYLKDLDLSNYPGADILTGYLQPNGNIGTIRSYAANFPPVSVTNNGFTLPFEQTNYNQINTVKWIAIE
ncbi:hypothetical protein NST81_02010 [Bacillus sp. FSL W8-0223]|uniref:hypothetical protein n=1 Tax=Bacillus sp. FSL W8-0223 TaxID=2954595 RepID=UPI0030F4C4F8